MGRGCESEWGCSKEEGEARYRVAYLAKCAVGGRALTVAELDALLGPCPSRVRAERRVPSARRIERERARKQAYYRARLARAAERRVAACVAS